MMEGSNRLICPDCEFTTRKDRKLVKHMWKSHNKQALKCPYCVPSVYSSSPSGLVRHKRQKHREARLNCFLCVFSTRSLKKWARHVKQNHAAQMRTLSYLVCQNRGCGMSAPSGVGSCKTNGADKISGSSVTKQDCHTRAGCSTLEPSCLNFVNNKPREAWSNGENKCGKKERSIISKPYKLGKNCQFRLNNTIQPESSKMKEIRKSCVTEGRNISDQSVVNDCIDEIVVSDDNDFIKVNVPTKEDVVVIASDSDSVENTEHSDRNSRKMKSVEIVCSNDSSKLLLEDRLSKFNVFSNEETKQTVLSDDVNIAVKLKVGKTSRKAKSNKSSSAFASVETRSAISKPHQLEGREGEDLLSKSELIATVLNQQEKISPKCPYCNSQFSDYKMLKAHCMTEHAAYIHPKFKCLKCAYEAEFISGMVTHNRVHTREKPFSCHLCHGRFSLKDKLHRHLKAHFKDRPFRCKLCPFTSTQKKGLIEHIRTHTNERPYKCSMCDYAGKTHYTLKVHIRTHTKEKPYQCRYCLRYFTHKSSVKTHVSKGSCPLTYR